MIRSELIGKLVETYSHLPRLVVEAALDAILNEILDGLAVLLNAPYPPRPILTCLSFALVVRTSPSTDGTRYTDDALSNNW